MVLIFAISYCSTPFIYFIC